LILLQDENVSGGEPVSLRQPMETIFVISIKQGGQAFKAGLNMGKPQGCQMVYFQTKNYNLA
jgi:trehalose utilization protein